MITWWLWAFSLCTYLYKASVFVSLMQMILDSITFSGYTVEDVESIVGFVMGKREGNLTNILKFKKFISGFYVYVFQDIEIDTIKITG